MILDARAEQLEHCTNLSEKVISRACTQHLIFQSDGIVPEKEKELYKPFIRRVFFKLLENNWITESSRVEYKASAFKLHTNKFRYGNSGDYHLDRFML